MKRMGCLVGLCLLAAAQMWAPAHAAAQDPDLREIMPYLMLVVDTSGSMERLVSCTCTTRGCTECLPNCSLANGPGGIPPKTAPPENHELKKNRWATTLEALTGGMNNFECEPLARTTANGMTYDVGWKDPYFQPWDCQGQLPGTACAFDATGVSTLSQNANGILDLYAARIQFGLMTFDGWDTYVGQEPLIAVEDFNVATSQSVSGLWSYGPIDPESNKQGKTFHYPNCTHDYIMDTGARSPLATEGALVSLNSCTGVRGSATCQSWCSQCPATQTSINQDIQSALIRARPYGGTPIAASLDDLYFHLKNDLTDAFGSCRNRYALLLTDGEPDADYRQVGCDCRKTENPTSPKYCGGPPNDPAKMHCPYPTSIEAASDLIHGRTNDTPMIQQLFVVGMAVDNSDTVTSLDAIAHAGCPNASCDPDGDNHEAFFANDLNQLLQNLSTILDGTIKPVSRSVPAFAEAGSDINVNVNHKQFQVSSGFKLPKMTGDPWTGLIERKRFTCEPDLTEKDIDSSAGDLFQDVLNLQGPRQLLTIAPTTLPGGVTLDSALFSGSGSDPCGTGHCSLTALGNVRPDQLGLAPSDITSKNLIVSWMDGSSGTVRANKRLGDVYHSSPVVIGAPRFDTADEAFNRFRQRADVSSRPLTLFVGTNDGILHAFSMDDYANTVSGVTYRAGQEMWGFVPPMFLNDLAVSLNTHQFMVDGTPAIKNVYFSRDKSADATGQEYHTVLVVGMREGGKSYVALDITDVTQPVFLWQFTDPHMGFTFAQAAIGQATFMDMSSGTGVPKNGAVAILPGGVGDAGESGISGDCTDHVSNPSMRDPGTGVSFVSYLDVPTSGSVPGSNRHRDDVKCWKDIGRALYFVDVENGRLLKKIHADSAGKLVFPSPLVSTPALFENDIGTIASRAFITDASGVIWRVDLSASDQDENIAHTRPLTGWTARPFHDIFWGMLPGDGELSYEAPILTADPAGNLVVIVGTGDNNNFVKPTIANRVVSLTEIADPTGQPGFKAAVNWEVRMDQTKGLSLVPSELVTGSMGLFNGQLFFGTFMAVTGSNACDLGKGRIHAVDYLARDPAVSYTNPSTSGPRRLTAAELGLDAEAQTVINVDAASAVPNLMEMGLGVTQRPTCQQLDTQNFNVWGQSTWGAKTVTAPAIYLVAQASGSVTTTSLIQKRHLSEMGSIQLKLTKKSSLSRMISWATSID